MAGIADQVRRASLAARSQVQSRSGAIRGRLAAGLSAVRKRWPWFDHISRAYGLYQDKRGGSLAGATTFFTFLSFFPLVALAFSVAGYAATISSQAADWLRTAIESVLPGLANQLPLQSIANARTDAGVVGLVGLLIVGLGGVASVRDGLHVIWGSARKGGNPLVNKAWDTGVLVALGFFLLMSAAATTLATPAAHGALGWAGLGGSTFGQVAIRLLAIAVALVFDVVMFALVFSRLSGADLGRQQLLRGALLAAAGFETLKLAAVFLVTRTTHNPIYASFAVMVGLLVWINLVARLTYLAAAWTATSRPGPAPPDEPVSAERERDGHGADGERHEQPTGR